jgi:signal transduction histidine kinase/DNA-binding response OmpR family regulator
MIARWFLSLAVLIGLTGGTMAQAAADTTQVAIHLDSAFKLMKKVDPRAVPFLEQLLQTSRNLSFKRGEAEALFCLGEYYSLHEEEKRSWQYFDSARIAFEALAHKARWAQSLNMLGSLKIRASLFAESIPYFRKAAEINLALGRKQQLGDCYYNLAIANNAMGEYVEALQYYVDVLKIDEEIGYQEGVADDYSNISRVYEKMNDIPHAIESLKKSISISEATGSKPTMSASYTNYGLLLKNIGQYKEARSMLQRSLDIARELKSQRMISIALHNMASLHNAEGHYAEALKLFRESLAQGIAATNLVNEEGIAQAYLHLKDYGQATEYAHRALRQAEETNQMDGRKRLNLLLSEIATTRGDFREALTRYQLYATLKDSLLTLEKTKQMQNIRARYDTEKKEAEIAGLTQERQLQDANLRQKTYIQYALMGGLVMLIAFGTITFRIFRSRQEARRQLLAQQLSHEQQEAERMKELDRTKSRFFANIAHEFRTPLTLILGPVENLLSTPQPPQQREQLVMVKNNTSRLVKLVNQLLDLSKLEAGAIQFEYVHEDIVPFLKSLAFSFQSLADQKKISLHFASEPSAIVTRFDYDKMEKVFSNLLSNAFKFTPEQGLVSMDVSLVGEQIKVSVRDSGPGIPAQDLPYIFNRFYQSGGGFHALGSGIGLELTKELVEISGGKISVTNGPEGGAHFVVMLPLMPEATTAETKTKAYLPTPHLADREEEILQVKEESNPTDDERKTLLVIEDVNEVRDFIVQSLSAHYQVITAAHGGEGIAKALEIIPDLIITDVMMPVKDGLEVCRTLKETDATSHIPVMMLTAKADVGNRIEGLETGADDYLAKPFHTKELLARIHNLILIREKLLEKFHQKTPGQIQALPNDERLPREKKFLEQLHQAIDRHLAEEEYSVAELSDDMAMSRMQLHRKVKALTGLPVSLYIRSIRLERGKRLLEEGLYNVSEVAYRVGFNSPAYFSTCFSEQYGHPPSEIKGAGRGNTVSS